MSESDEIVPDTACFRPACDGEATERVFAEDTYAASFGEVGELYECAVHHQERLQRWEAQRMASEEPLDSVLEKLVMRFAQSSIDGIRVRKVGPDEVVYSTHWHGGLGTVFDHAIRQLLEEGLLKVDPTLHPRTYDHQISPAVPYREIVEKDLRFIPGSYSGERRIRKAHWRQHR